ncbi:glutaminyl-peptide cyclotransferase [Iris pallida]|uniref:Glutaminyl-peptide cyclotransferase n=1 Tax=Iris pallida TaxID=29817 RepID=A0AAX6I675_IRIPA|nr:glutaminyl-peptide cyclotransferase [Iris pallida]KAJ6848722.1 glutaminyl-peptide cyclotransferase [Iris pallida]
MVVLRKYSLEDMLMVVEEHRVTRIIKEEGEAEASQLRFLDGFFFFFLLSSQIQLKAQAFLQKQSLSSCNPLLLLHADPLLRQPEEDLLSRICPPIILHFRRRQRVPSRSRCLHPVLWLDRNKRTCNTL